MGYIYIKGTDSKMNETINYIIRFLLGVHRSGAYSSLIGYTSDEYLFNKYKVVIIPSDFFSSSDNGQYSCG